MGVIQNKKLHHENKTIQRLKGKKFGKAKFVAKFDQLPFKIRCCEILSGGQNTLQPSQ